APAERRAALIGAMVDWVESQIPRFGSIPTTRLGGLDADVEEALPSAAASSGDRADAAPLGARIWTVAEETPTVKAQSELGFVEGPAPSFVHFTGRLDELDLTAPELP